MAYDRSALESTARKFLESIPGDAWGRGEVLVRARKDEENYVALLKAAEIMNKAEMIGEKRVQAFLRQKANYEKSNFGWMGGGDRGSTKQ